MKYYEVVPVHIVSFEDTYTDEMGGAVTPHAHGTSILELVEFMAGMAIKDQVYMLANTLTIAGYSQREIAEALGVSYKTYRNRLWEIRTDFKDRGLVSI